MPCVLGWCGGLLDVDLVLWLGWWQVAFLGVGVEDWGDLLVGEDILGVDLGGKRLILSPLSQT